MSQWCALWRAIGGILLGLLLAGCFPTSESSLDEQKDPHFIDGRSHLRTQDFRGAAESFERALQNNPKSAAAHFELGVLYETQLNDPIAAIYHFQKHLTLNTNSDLRDLIQTRISLKKVEIARSSAFWVVNAAAQEHISNLQRNVQTNAYENAALRSDRTNLLLQLAQVRADLSRKPLVVTNYVTNYVRVQSAPTQQAIAAAATPPRRELSPSVYNNSTPATRYGVVQGGANPRTSPTPSAPLPKPVAPATKTHSVKKGETLSGIAGQHGISLASLLAANRNVSPNRLREGMVLTLPAPH